MSMFKGFSNAFRIPELRKKILVTLGLIFVCRLISSVPTPGVDWVTMQRTIENFRANSGLGGGVLDWISVFTGGGLENCAIGVLSIWPYISAQIVIQLLSSVIPFLEKLKQEGESGRQKLAEITRYLTIFLCVVQSVSIAFMLMNPAKLHPDFANVELVANPGMGFVVMTVIGITTASLFVMWLADQITTFGIGNGASLIIMINIASRLPQAIYSAWSQYIGIGDVTPEDNGIAKLALLLAFGFAVVMGTVMLTQGVRKVQIHATRRSAGGAGGFGMQQTYMPLRVNYTGVMPIIFAQPLLSFPSMLLASWFKDRPGWFAQKLYWLGTSLSDMGSPLHLTIYAILIMFFAFFWVATQFNAVQIAENLKRSGSYVPGIRPGMATAEYLDGVMTRVTLIGGTGLLIVALLPQVLNGWMHVPWSISSFFGGTSLLIIVGVALDTLRIMESHLLVRKYDGFLRHGSLKGRGGM